MTVETATNTHSSSRISSIDILRGLVIVIMALDHARDFFTDVPFSPTDLEQTTPVLFLTRWITHICAPVFVFLAGTSVYLGVSGGRTKAELSKFLLTRGAILALLDLTLITFGWNFSLSYLTFLNVVWAIGISMIVLAGLIHLPMRAIIVIGAIMVLGHNLLDGVSSEYMSGGLAVIWQILHERAFVDLGWIRFVVIYPLIPWIGLMALGYALGTLYKQDEESRQKILMKWGLGLIAAFFVIRGINIYGDPGPWIVSGNLTQTILSFFNATKYPASLDFLLMTMGPALIFLSYFEKIKGTFAKVMIVFGRVPLFFYIVHIYFLHLLASLTGVLMGFPAYKMFKNFGNFPEDWGFNLVAVYVIWIAAVAALYPVCLWFAGLKKRKNSQWLTYF